MLTSPSEVRATILSILQKRKLRLREAITSEYNYVTIYLWCDDITLMENPTGYSEWV